MSQSRSFALSPTQEGMLFEYLSIPDHRHFNTMRLSRTLIGSLRIEDLKKAFGQVVMRHEALRTSFQWEDLDRAVQVVHPHIALPFHFQDLRQMRREDKALFLESQAWERRMQAFDLTHGPLFEIYLYQTEDAVFELYMRFHHSVWDGASANILIKDLAAALNGSLQGQPSAYSDFVEQSLKMDWEPAKNYWRQVMADYPAHKCIPQVAPALAVGNPQRRMHLFSVPKDLHIQLSDLQKNHKISVNRSLQGALAILLSRYCGEEDVCLGNVVSVRKDEKFAASAGNFVNVVPLRIRVPADAESLPWLKVLDQTWKAGLDHIQCPLPVIKECSGIGAGKDLFEVSLNIYRHEDVPSAPLEVSPSLTIHARRYREELGNSWTELPVAINYFGGADSAIRIDYDPNQIDAQFVERMGQHFINLLKAILANPTAKISQLNMLAEGEYRQIVRQWNATQKTYSEREKCVHQLFEAQVDKTPDATALVFEGQKMSYAELNRRANKLANYLRKQGVGPDTMVGLCTYRSFELMISLFAVLKAGGAYVPIDPLTPKDRVEMMLEDCNPQLILCHTVAADLISQRWRTFNFADWGKVDGENDQNLPNLAKPDHLAYGIFTSGSTGRPKCALNNHRGVVNWLLWLQDEYHMDASERVLQKTPFTFDVSVGELFWTLNVGAQLVLAATGGHKDPSYLADIIREHEITTINFVPSMLAVFLDHPEVEQCTSLKRTILIGEAVTFDLQQRFFAKLQSELLNLYGPTEAAVTVTAWRCLRNQQGKTVPIGKPMSNVQMYVLDKQLNPVPVGIIGELHIGGVAVGRGYLNREELTAQKFIKDPFRDEFGARIYATGDLARYLPDGNIECLGRTDFQVKIRGNRIELGDIENSILKFPGVRETVVTVYEKDGEKSLLAYVVSNKGAKVIAEQLRNYLNRELPEYMVPTYFVNLDAMPLNSSGKVDRKQLPPPNVTKAARQASAPATTDLGKTLVQLWEKVLQVKPIGIQDNYFSIGGTSLKAMQIAMAAKKAGIHVKPTDMFDCATIEKLEAHINKSSVMAKSIAEVSGGRFMTVEELCAESKLDPSIKPPEATPPGRSRSRVLLTGASGFLGAHLLRDLLDTMEGDIWCLIRAQSVEQGLQRIQQNSKLYSQFDPQAFKRVKVVVGDIAKPRFGLSLGEFSHLAAQVDVIYHLAAWVNHIYPFAVLKAANVGGTEEVLRLACLDKVKPVHMFSSISVGTTHEDMALDEAIPVAMPYVQTKWVAEKMAWTAHARGLPVAVYRPGLTTWNSSNGVASVAQFECLMLGTCIEMGMIPDSATMEQLLPRLSPVDFTSKAIVDLSLRPESIGQAFHVLNPEKVNWDNMIRRMSEHGFGLRQVSYAEWASHLKEQAEATQSPYFSSLDSLLVERFSKRPKVSCEKTVAALTASGISCPDVEKSVGKFLKFLASTEYVPSMRRKRAG